ncbi:MAG: THUMP domain-containing protein [Bacteroidota bacterium]
MKYIAKTLAGLEEVLMQELEAIGATDIQKGTRVVYFEGDLKILYRANYELRTSIRILAELTRFKAFDENVLYREIKKINWSDYLSLEQTFAIDAVVHSKQFTHSKYVALKTKDAIADQFRERQGKRPSVNPRTPDVRIHVHISQTQCTVSLDSSGDSLHKRGYRTETLAAPISETLAAGMILLSGWNKDCALIDPMCGSGTIIIEAAMIAYNIPPQRHRTRFGFMQWANFDKNLWEQVVEEANSKITDFEHPLLAFDKDFKAMKVASQNVINAELEGKVSVRKKKFEKLERPAERGFIIMNPPYDERLTLSVIEDLYKMIGDRLKQEFNGYEAWIISSNKEALKHVGLRPSSKRTLFNGKLECKFHKYELYAGTRRAT